MDALITDHVDKFILLAIAGLNAYTVYKMRVLGAIVVRTEMNTNSMKDALVKTTAEASHAAGLQEGRNEPRK